MDPDAEADYIMLPMNKNRKFSIVLIYQNMLLSESMLILRLCLDAEQLCKQEVKVKIDAHADKSNVDRKPIISESGEGKYKVFSFVILSYSCFFLFLL